MPVTAIVLAAGEGIRMKSHHPKVVHKVLDKPLVWWSVRAAREAGVDRIVVVVGNGADEVRACLAGEDVTFVEQTERLGTGHAVMCVRDALGSFDGPVVVLSGDSPLLRPETIRDLIARTREAHNACTVLTMTPPDVTGYGRLDFAEDGSVRGIIEHKDCTPEQRERLTECNSGVYCFCGGRLAASRRCTSTTTPSCSASTAVCSWRRPPRSCSTASTAASWPGASPCSTPIWSGPAPM